MIKVDRRTEIVTIAQQLFYTKGYERTSVNDIINVAGLSKGGFYHHFDSKQAVLWAVVDELISQSSTMIEPILANDNLNALEKFKQITTTVNDWKIERREQMLTLIEGLFSDENLRLRDRLMDESKRVTLPVWTQILEQGVAEGVFDLGGIGESYAAEFIILLLRNSGETFARLLLDPNRPADSVAIVIEKYASAEKVIQRILGISAGSLQLIDPHDISAWFE
ncbi:MAG: TetR/AcrR family transcriptional regulator [Anaerolineae bacterium]